MYSVECPLCNKMWTSHSLKILGLLFLQHLPEHTIEDLVILEHCGIKFRNLSTQEVCLIGLTIKVKETPHSLKVRATYDIPRHLH
jgi:hypothetical protein